MPHIELDALFHGPEWTPRPGFREDVTEAVAGPAWVVDGNYGSTVRDVVWARAEAVVWLDLPRRVVFPALLARSLRRGWTGEELWNGNRERLGSLLAVRPEENLLLWTWRAYPRYRKAYSEAMADPSLAHLTFVHLRRREDVSALLESV